MYFLLAAASPFYALQHTDLFGKGIVAYLMFTSIIAWTIMIDKWYYLRNISNQAVGLFSDATGPLPPVDVVRKAASLQGPFGQITAKAVREIARLRQIVAETVLSDFTQKAARPPLSQTDFEQVRSVIDEAVDEEVMRMESNMSVLGAIVGSSTYFGLLGTVWGVMMTFCAMAIHGRAEISAIAPGVSGALLTTVSGLLVAIPALIGYNLLLSRAKFRANTFDHFADKLLHCIRSSYQSGNGG